MKSNKETPALIYTGITHQPQTEDKRAIIILHGFDSSSSAVYFMLSILSGYAKHTMTEYSA